VGDGGGSIWRTQNVDNLSVTQLEDLKVKRRRDFGALGLIQRRDDYPILARLCKVNMKVLWR
jgi:hypothetical protein